MTFEEALSHEMEQLVGLQERVYPLFAPKGIKPPFLIYRKENLKFKKVLSGTLTKAEGLYDLMVVTEDYGQLQQISEDLKNKLLSFLGRSIGIDGPLIENVTVEFTGDGYEVELDACRSDLKLKVNY